MARLKETVHGLTECIEDLMKEDDEHSNSAEEDGDTNHDYVGADELVSDGNTAAVESECLERSSTTEKMLETADENPPTKTKSPEPNRRTLVGLFLKIILIFHIIRTKIVTILFAIYFIEVRIFTFSKGNITK